MTGLVMSDEEKEMNDNEQPPNRDEEQEAQLAEFVGWAKKANLKNIMTKLKAGKTLSATEANLIESESQQIKNKGKTFFRVKTELAPALGMTRPTLDKKMRIPGFPLQDARKGWCLEDCIEFLEDASSKKGPGTKVSKASTEGIAPGAEFALSRLEQEEIQAYANYKAAQDAGDMDLITQTWNLWHNITSKLRDFERTIDKDKRDAGEYIQKHDAIHIMEVIGQSVMNAEQAFLDVFGVNIARLKNSHDPREVRQAGKSILYGKLEESLGQILKDDGVPRWVKEAFSRGVRP